MRERERSQQSKRERERSQQSKGTEFAELGSLDLLSERHEIDLDQFQREACERDADALLTAVMQVLDGILQLREHKIVHCDLALRNILVFRFNDSYCDQVHVKITDYQ